MLGRRRTDDEVTAQLIEDRWNRAKTATDRQRQQAALNRSFARNGNQWVYWNQHTHQLEEWVRDPNKARVTMPRIGPDTRRLMSKILRRPLAFEVPPTSADDVAMRGAHIATAALYTAHAKQGWEALRADHAWTTWEGGYGALCLEWDPTRGEPLPGVLNKKGGPVLTGDIKISVLSGHECGTVPGSPDITRSRWWIRAQALPPEDVKDLYNLKDEPEANAHSVEDVYSLRNDFEQTRLTMVLTHYERPGSWGPGGVHICVGGKIVAKGDWPFPWTDEQNIEVARAVPLHNTWVGGSPITDAIGPQVAYNMAWSSIIEHLKNAGNARMWIPMGSVDDIEELTDQAGEFVPYNPINGMKPGYEAPPAMPDWWARLPDAVAAVADDVLSVHDVSRGDAPSGIESGIALSVLLEADDTPIGAFAKELGECWGRIASKALKLYEVKVQETREAPVRMPGRTIPELVQWKGADLAGQTTAVVPLDAVLPRSRAAQAAFAMQLYDKGIITDPALLARVAELPDQTSFIEALDPDTARAIRENFHLAAGIEMPVDQIDDHANHITIIRNHMRSAAYQHYAPEIQTMFVDHLAAHENYAMEQAASQMANAMVGGPMVAMVPTGATKPLDPAAVAAAVQQQQAAAMAAQQQPPGEGGEVPDEGGEPADVPAA